jgi:hypothetical protein
MAKSMTVEYLKQSNNKGSSTSSPRSNPDCCPPAKPHEEDKEKVFIVYKIIQTPIDAIIAGM